MSVYVSVCLSVCVLLFYLLVVYFMTVVASTADVGQVTRGQWPNTLWFDWLTTVVLVVTASTLSSDVLPHNHIKCRSESTKSHLSKMPKTLLHKYALFHPGDVTIIGRRLRWGQLPPPPPPAPLTRVRAGHSFIIDALHNPAQTQADISQCPCSYVLSVFKTALSFLWFTVSNVFINLIL